MIPEVRLDEGRIRIALPRAAARAKPNLHIVTRATTPKLRGLYLVSLLPNLTMEKEVQWRSDAATADLVDADAGPIIFEAMDVASLMAREFTATI